MKCDLLVAPIGVSVLFARWRGYLTSNEYKTDWCNISFEKVRQSTVFVFTLASNASNILIWTKLFEQRLTIDGVQNYCLGQQPAPICLWDSELWIKTKTQQCACSALHSWNYNVQHAIFKQNCKSSQQKPNATFSIQDVITPFKHNIIANNM